MELSDNSIQAPVFAMIAGEASGDTLGADLLLSLKQRYPNARFVGIGGSKMLSNGFESWFPMEKLSIMGLFEVLKHLPELLSLRKSLIKQLIELKPDVVIGIDAPDFNFKVEQAMKENGIPAIHYVGPSVWAWRESRLNRIKHQVDGVLVLFPFELPLYEKYGIPAQFVGHPLANQVPAEPNQFNARQQLGLDKNCRITGILPGSRMSEINQMMDVYVQAAVRLHDIYPDMQFVVPCVHERAKNRIQQSINEYGQEVPFLLLDQQAQLAMEASDQLIVTSGTATLEAALMERPLVLAIKLHPITHWIMRRLATTNWIGLPNVLAQETLVPEYIQQDATPEKIALGIGKLISDPAARAKQLEAFQSQKIQLRQNASEIAADTISKWAKLSK